MIMLFLGSACSKVEEECSNNSDCLTGWMCVDGECVEIGGGDSDTDTGVGPIDTETGTDPGSTDTGVGPIDTETGTGPGGTETVDTDTGTDPDTEPQITCTRNLECNDHNPCTVEYCDPETWTCVVQPVAGNPTCTGDGLFCSGQWRCSAGECLATGDPCADIPPGDSTSTCFEQTGFVCMEASRSCESVGTPKNDGAACSPELFCLGDRSRVCQSGVCVNPPDAANPCVGDTTWCRSAVCSEATRACQYTAINQGQACLENNSACQQGFCDDGQCDWGNPCQTQMNNPCVAQTCINPGTTMGDYDCWNSNRPNNEACVPPLGDPCINPATYSSGYCWTTHDMGQCIQPQNRPCYDVASLCGAVYRCDGAFSPNPCQQITAPILKSLTCGQTATFTNEHFLTRHFYDYGAACAGGDYRGMELLVTLDEDEFAGGPRNVTVLVHNDTPSQVFNVLYLSDYCDATSCMTRAVDSLSVTGMVETDLFVLEAEPGYPPLAVDVTMQCN